MQPILSRIALTLVAIASPGVTLAQPAEASAATAPASTLEVIYEDSSRKILIDTESFKRIGNNASVLMVTIFTSPRTTYPGWLRTMEKPVKYWQEELVFRCGANKFSQNYDRMLDADMNEVSTSMSGLDGGLHFFDIAINTDRDTREIQYEAVCNR